MITGGTLVLFALFASVIQNTTPLYTASAQLAFDGQDSAYINTQIYDITSFDRAKQVAEDLSLVNDPEFNAHTAKPYIPQFKTLNIDDADVEKSFSQSDEKTAHIARALRQSLYVSYIPNSHVVSLAFTHETPKTAENILGSFVQNFLKDSSSVVSQNVMEAQYDEHITSLADEQVNSEENDAEKKETTAAQDKAQHEYLVAKAHYETFLDESGKVFLNINAPIITTDKTISALKEEYSNIVYARNNLSHRYGPKHPKMVALDLEIAQKDKRLQKEYLSIRNRTTADYKHKQAIFFQLQRGDNNSEIGVEEFMSQIQPAAGGIGFARILSDVNTSQYATFPNKSALISLALALSFIIALLTAIIFERNRKTFISGKQAEQILGRPCYALIPQVESDKDKLLSDYVLNNPSSDVAEAVRALRLTIKLQAKNSGTESKVVMLTSSSANEGKTTISSWLARLSAQSGERVLLIDGDLRNPSVHKSLSTKNTASLVDYLGGAEKLDTVIDKTDTTGLHVIHGRSVPNSALDLVSSDKLEQLIRAVKKSYDLIIIDTPACMAVSDARALQPYADILLYIVGWNSTKHEVVHSGLSQFLHSETPRIATVLSNIDVKKHVQFGFGEIIGEYGPIKA